MVFSIPPLFDRERSENNSSRNILDGSDTLLKKTLCDGNTQCAGRSRRV